MRRKSLRLLISILFFALAIGLMLTVPRTDEAYVKSTAMIFVLLPLQPANVLSDVTIWRLTGILCLAGVAFYILCGLVTRRWIYWLFLPWSISYITSLWYIRTFEQDVLLAITIDIRQLGGFSYYILCVLYIVLLLRVMNKPTSRADFNGVLFSSITFSGTVLLRRIIGPNFGSINGSISQSLIFGLLGPTLLLLLISSIYLPINSIRLIRQDIKNEDEIREL